MVLTMLISTSLVLFSTIFIFNYDITQAIPQGRACCYALTAHCLACARGVSETDYCRDFPDTNGCHRVLNQGEFQDPINQTPNWPDQGKEFSNISPQSPPNWLDQEKDFSNSLPQPLRITDYNNPSIIVARKKRSSISCKIHQSVCKYWCRIAGHSSGTCDIEGECLCSEDDLEKYICDPDEEGPGNKTQHTLCAGWCQLKGQQSGDCDINAKECVCTEASLGASHAKCIDDTICSMWCQVKERKATGKCEGEHNWDCVCKSAPKDKDNEIE